ncbi:hypothetical protein F511_15154 [Dorcoceras hygrometricum]|uniref:Uncharacterized protein n=1 Tax=Dorcoceras hygrometricum TaxID=472368 RepID=A0A2Z7DEL5_9LAMI|nr:hypothetical protein F511_15154 [Dorcoceras hygrometricum]
MRGGAAARILLEKLAGASPASEAATARGVHGGDGVRLEEKWGRRLLLGSRTPQNPLPLLNTLSSVSMRESRIQYLCDPQWFRDTANRGPTTIVAPESQFRTCPSDYVSQGNRHFSVDGGRLRQSGPRSDARLLRQPALEGLTRSVRTDSPRQVGRNSFRRLKAAAAVDCLERKGAAAKILGLGFCV